MTGVQTCALPISLPCCLATALLDRRGSIIRRIARRSRGFRRSPAAHHDLCQRDLAGGARQHRKGPRPDAVQAHCSGAEQLPELAARKVPAAPWTLRGAADLAQKIGVITPPETCIQSPPKPAAVHTKHLRQGRQKCIHEHTEKHEFFVNTRDSRNRAYGAYKADIHAF